ncbi:butyrate kinase [Tepidanaerobacter syntrophicus]|uniref:butyrate kinase n=1 Tax=Tepidanaerobacter syntrophicus TaxID=224999 RepID=UPI001BD27DD2|nr:butyrate kinase [Tepidanaerobacter syntrophicus]
MAKERILAINPGSTSTKIGVYDDDQAIFVTTISHPREELDSFKEIFDQYEYRKRLVLEVMEQNGVDRHTLTAVVARGGLLPPVPAGAFEVNDDMIWQLKYKPQNEHASNLGAPIAKAIADELGIKAYIYDPVTVDEMSEIAKITGLPEMRRKSLIHALNMRAMAHKYAEEIKKPYESLRLIVAHLGGGITLSYHENGKMIDVISDEEGPFSPERTGCLPLFQVLEMATQPGSDFKTLYNKVKRQGGLMAHLGTNNAKEVEEMIAAGDKHAELIYKAMGYNIAKWIGNLATVAKGKVDCIILTGGVAYSKMLTDFIKERIEFIAPVKIMAGENEIEALVKGVLRIRRGQEKVNVFTKVV